MKKITAIILAILTVCAALTAAVCAAGNVETLYSDEFGDYYSYESGAVKAYVRLNQDTVTAAIENGVLVVYDSDGNELTLSFGFDFSGHQWIQEVMDEYIRQNTIDGAIPEIGVSLYDLQNTGIDDEIKQEPDEWPDWGSDQADGGLISEGGAVRPGAAANPHTGIVLAAAPGVLAAAITLIFRKKQK